MNRSIAKSALFLCLSVPGLLLINFFWLKSARSESVRNMKFNRHSFCMGMDDSTHLPKAEMYVFNVWATWCSPCIGEMPELNKLKGQYAGEKVAFVSITTEDSAKVKAFFENPKHRFDYTHLIENPGTVDFLEMLNTDTTLKFAETNIIPVNIITYHEKIVYYNIGADEENIHRMDSVLKKYTGLNP